MHPHRHLRPGLGSQRDLPVDPGGLAPGVALRHLPHADQRVSAAPQHQLLQVPDPGPVLLLRRLEDPLPQPPYLPLPLPPVDLAPSGGCVLFPGPALRSVRPRGRRDLGHGGTDPGAAVPYRGGEAVARHAPNLPFGSSGSDRITAKTHLPTSAPFRVRAAARYPAGYAGRPAEGRPRAPVSRRLTAHRHSLPGHPGPARGPGPRCLRLTGGTPGGAPDPDGVSTFRMREQRPGWAPPRPRGQRCSHGRRRSVRTPLAVPPRPGPAPRCSSHLPGLWVTRHQRGFTHVRPSGLPLACAPGWSGNASASSLSFTPRSYPRRTSGRELALNTGQKLRHRHHRPSSLQAHSQHATSCRTPSAQSSPMNSNCHLSVPSRHVRQHQGEPPAP